MYILEFMIGTGNLKTESTYETLVRWAFFKKFFLTKLPMKSALNVALCFKPLVGGASGRTWVGAEQCRPEAWAVRGKASMPEAPS
jgi:hypothetical protein